MVHLKILRGIFGRLLVRLTGWRYRPMSRPRQPPVIDGEDDHDDEDDQDSKHRESEKSSKRLVFRDRDTRAETSKAPKLYREVEIYCVARLFV